MFSISDALPLMSELGLCLVSLSALLWYRELSQPIARTHSLPGLEAKCLPSAHRKMNVSSLATAPAA